MSLLVHNIYEDHQQHDKQSEIEDMNKNDILRAAGGNGLILLSFTIEYCIQVSELIFLT
jgi:cellobiose-specific phosphotransferase system component IIB